MTDQVTPASRPEVNTTDLKTRWGETKGRTRQSFLGPFANNPIEGPPDTNWGDEDSPEYDNVPNCDDDASQISVHAADAAPSGRDGASEQTRKGSEATVVEADTTSLYSNPLLRKAQLRNMQIRSTGASFLTSWSARCGKISENKQSKRHDTQQVFRAPKSLAPAQGTNGQASVSQTSLTEHNLDRVSFPAFQPDGTADTATRDGSNNSDVPKWVNSLSPPEEQVEALGEQPCATEGTDKAQYDAAVPEAKAHHESGMNMNMPDGLAVAVSLSNPSNDLMSQATGNTDEHTSPSTDSTAARALPASQTEAGPDSAPAWSLDNVQKLITSREKIVRGIPRPRGSLAIMTPGGGLTRKIGTPGEGLCELLSDFRKAERPIISLESSLAVFRTQLSSWQDGLSQREELAVRELCDLTKAFDGLRSADKLYEEVFGPKWMDPSGIQGCEADLTRAIQEDARAPIDLTKDGRLSQIVAYFSRTSPPFWGPRLTKFIESRTHRANARRVLNTVYQSEKFRTKISKSHCTATSVSKPDPGSGQLQRLPPWRPSLFSADANRVRQVAQHCTVDKTFNIVLNKYRAAGLLMTALEAVEAGPEDFFKRNDWFKTYMSSAGDLKSVHETQQLTSLEEGLTEAKRKHMSVWSSALQAASARLYDEKSNERKPQGLKRIKEHLDAHPPELTLTQYYSKAGDKPAYTWNEDEDIITEHLATTALEWNFERGGSFTLDLHDQDDLSRAPLRKVRQEFIDIEQRVSKLGQMRTSRQERATNFKTELLSTLKPAEEKSTTTAPAKGGATEAKSVVGSKWAPDDDERRVLGPLRDAKDRIDQVLDDVQRLDSEFSSKLATLRKQLEKHEATQSDQDQKMMTRTKNQIRSLLDTWSTYSKYDRSRDGLQDLDESAHDDWTDFFSRSKSAFADRCALIPNVQDLAKQGYEGVSTLGDREKDGINKEDQFMARRFMDPYLKPQTPDEESLWTNAAKENVEVFARMRERANEATKISQHNQAETTRGVAECSSPFTQSDTSESTKASESLTLSSSAGPSDVSTITLTGSDLST